jgi:FixJ family two-component response regulator
MPGSETRPVLHLVDDDPSVRSSLGRLLRSMGFDIETYASAEEFLDAGQIGPGCLILDVQLPGLSGPELQEELARSPRQTPPIVFIAAREDPEVRERALAAGAVAFLQKPFSAREILEAIQLALGSRATVDPPADLPAGG